MTQGRRGLLAGHMARALTAIQENLRLVDAVIEVADARAPQTSRNPFLQRLIKGKELILVLNKADLASEDITRRWCAHFRQQGVRALALEGISGRGVEALVSLLQEGGDDPARLRPRMRVMVAGIPNVGKSSLINRLAGGARVRTGARPGVTRGKQWIITRGFELLDLPGVLPPYIRSRDALLKLGVLGAVEPDGLSAEDMALYVIQAVRQAQPRMLEMVYGINDESVSPEEVLEEVGRRRGCIRAGGAVDAARAAGVVLKDFRLGRLGSLSLEEPPLEKATGEGDAHIK